MVWVAKMNSFTVEESDCSQKQDSNFRVSYFTKEKSLRYDFWITSPFYIKKGDKIFINDKYELHNENGPAIIGKDGVELYALNGKSIHWAEENKIKEKKKETAEYYLQFEKNDPPNDISDNNKYSYTLKKWSNKKGFHRANDLPALIWSDNDLHWYIDGKLHRDGDKPAVICYGLKYWYQKNNLHRLEGPALIDEICGREEYWLEGIKYSKEGWQEKVKEIKELEKIKEVLSKETSTLNVSELKLTEIEDRLSILEEENKALKKEIEILKSSKKESIPEEPKTDAPFLLSLVAASVGISALAESKKVKAKKKSLPKEEIVVEEKNELRSSAK